MTIFSQNPERYFHSVKVPQKQTFLQYSLLSIYPLVHSRNMSIKTFNLNVTSQEVTTLDRARQMIKL